MELRLLSGTSDKQVFSERLALARATRGAGFVEAQRSAIGRVHLTFGQLYGLFENETSGLNEMMAGFAMHDLEMFSQTCPGPDVRHLPPASVFECSELWAVVPGAANAIRHVGFILAGLLGAQALLVYPICKPWNLTGAYRGFEKVGEPIEWPYLRSRIDGSSMWVQPMTLQGSNLAAEIARASSLGFESYDNSQRIVFANPFPLASIRASQKLRRPTSRWDHKRAA